MVIKKRTSPPRETTTARSRTKEHDETRARSPFLTGLRQDVHQFVLANPNTTRRDVAMGLKLPNNVATARIKELIDEGYLFEPTGVTKRNPSGVNARVLRATDRPTGGSPLDKVRVEVTLTIDHNGRYGATASVVGGCIQNTASARPIKKQKITITAPHPDSYKSSMRDETLSTVSRMETQNYVDDIIDADYEIVDG